jgi:hypothetical protein
MANVPSEIYVKVMTALDWISQGRTPTDACDLAGTTTYWLKRLIADDEVVSALSAEAFERGHDTMADILLSIDTDTVYGSSDPKIMRVKSDNIKWYLSRRDQARYGDKVVIENKFTADKAIVEALSRGKQRVLEAARDNVVDIIATELVSDTDVSSFV